MKKVSTLSAIIIAKNEEKRIGKAIENVSFTNEIIVVDNGSTDQTADIAQRKGALVISSDSHDFSNIRTTGMKKAHTDWVLYLDADEEVTGELREEIISVVGLRSSKYISESRTKTQDLRSTIRAYFIPRRNIFLGHMWPTPDKQVRLFERKFLKGWKGTVHESAIVDGQIGELRSFMNHNTHRTLSEMVEKTNEWSTIEAQIRFDTHHPKMSWWRMYRVMLTTFFDYFITQKGYTVGLTGLIESIYQSFSTFITYAKLWEMQKKSGM